MTMTRHQRCDAAIACLPVDRPPRYVCGIACDVSSRILGRQAYTGTGSLHYAEADAWCKGDAAHEEFVEQVYRDLADVFRALDIDVFRMPWRMTAKPSRRLDGNTFVYGDPEGEHVVYRYSPQTGDFGPISSTQTALDDLDAFEAAVAARERRERETPPPVELPTEHQEMFRRFGEEFFLVCNGGDISVGLGEQAMLRLALAPGIMKRDMMLQARRAVRLGEALARSRCPRVLQSGGDLAGNGGLMYSPATFRDVVLPAYRWTNERLSPLGVHVFFRSDGDVWAIADMLFRDAGIPGFGEVDREAGMTAGRLREKYPRLVMWGNFSSRMLAWAKPAQIRDEARRIVDETRGSGYFQGCSNAILRGTPIENVEAMFDL